MIGESLEDTLSIAMETQGNYEINKQNEFKIF